jgi:hypothetical protein
VDTSSDSPTQLSFLLESILPVDAQRTFLEKASTSGSPKSTQRVISKSLNDVQTSYENSKAPESPIQQRINAGFTRPSHSPSWNSTWASSHVEVSVYHSDSIGDLLILTSQGVRDRIPFGSSSSTESPIESIIV